ncbi:Squidulin [Diplonema papillatum]|nr:Squidulin [Diplonema papillatum]
MTDAASVASADPRKRLPKQARNAGTPDETISHPLISAALLRQAKTLFESYEPVPGKGLPMPNLRRALKGMGYDYPLSYVKDLAFKLKQSQAIIRHNDASLRRMLRRESGVSAISSVSTAAVAGGGKDELFVDFRYFIEILGMRLEATSNDQSSDPENELRAAWEAFDTDGDGVLSAADLARTLESLELPSLRPEELVKALEQADFDCDGKVRFADFLKTMDTN